MPRTPEVYPSAFCPLSDDSTKDDSIDYFTDLRAGSWRLCLLFSFAATARGSTATLSGTVSDQNGAVIPGASVAVINIEQGFQRTTTTNDEGNFVVSLLPPGTYTVKAEQKGFNPLEVRDVVLNVNGQVILQIQLPVGAVGQTVSVAANVPRCEGTTLSHPGVGAQVYPLQTLTPPPPRYPRGFERIHVLIVETTLVVLLVLGCITLVMPKVRMFLEEWSNVQGASNFSHSPSSPAKTNALHDPPAQNSSHAATPAPTVHHAPLKNISVTSERYHDKKPSFKRRRPKKRS